MGGGCGKHTIDSVSPLRAEMEPAQRYEGTDGSVGGQGISSECRWMNGGWGVFRHHSLVVDRRVGELKCKWVWYVGGQVNKYVSKCVG